jgi:hypothetical protein
MLTRPAGRGAARFGSAATGDLVRVETETAAPRRLPA